MGRDGIETIGHESFMHILPVTMDFIDIGKYGYSAGYDKEAINFLKLNIKILIQTKTNMAGLTILAKNILIQQEINIFHLF